MMEMNVIGESLVQDGDECHWSVVHDGDECHWSVVHDGDECHWRECGT